MKPVGDLPLDQDETDWDEVDAEMFGGRLMQEKKLRDAINRNGKLKPTHLRAWAENMIDEGYASIDSLIVSWLRDVADALASTTEETEMEKLVVWLKRQRKLAETMTANKMWLLGRTDMIAYTLMEITTQFGEEEGDADRGD